MTINHCPCGQRLALRIRADGISYTITFQADGAGPSGEYPRPVTQCPGCHRNLYDALVAGQLKEATPCA